MSIILFASAKSSPGVTTTTLATGFAWRRRAVVVDADPASLSTVAAGYAKGTMDSVHGIIPLALKQHPYSTDVTQHLWEETQDLPSPAGPTAQPLLYLAGVDRPSQYSTLRDLTPKLIEGFRALHSHGIDALIDLGRITDTSAVQGWIQAADQVVVVMGNSLPQITATSRLSAELLPLINLSGVDMMALSLVIVDQPTKSTYSPQEITDLLNIPVLNVLPHDVNAAMVYSHGQRPLPAPKHARASYTRSIVALVEALEARLAARAQLISPMPNGGGSYE